MSRPEPKVNISLFRLKIESSYQNTFKVEFYVKREIILFHPNKKNKK